MHDNNKGQARYSRTVEMHVQVEIEHSLYE